MLKQDRVSEHGIPVDYSVAADAGEVVEMHWDQAGWMEPASDATAGLGTSDLPRTCQSMANQACASTEQSLHDAAVLIVKQGKHAPATGDIFDATTHEESVLHYDSSKKFRAISSCLLCLAIVLSSPDCNGGAVLMTLASQEHGKTRDVLQIQSNMSHLSKLQRSERLQQTPSGCTSDLLETSSVRVQVRVSLGYFPEGLMCYQRGSVQLSPLCKSSG